MRPLRNAWRGAAAAAFVALGALALPAPAAAHCDSLDGPVVKAAQTALDIGDVAPAVAWVRPEDERRIREAFERTLLVRKLGPEAKKLADLWFFETLVRVHREGEGAPYTGLKPAGSEPAPGIDAADHALEAGTVDELSAQLGENVVIALSEKFDHVIALRDHDARDVEAGRRYVHAYVDYIHFVEQLHELIHGDARAPGGAADPHGTEAGQAILTTRIAPPAAKSRRPDKESPQSDKG